MRILTLTPKLLLASGFAGLCLVMWLASTTAYLMFHQEIREAAHANLLDKQRAYEDRIASLRRQIDDINGRRFIEQSRFEAELAGVRARQAALEERQMQLAGLIAGARQRDVNLNLDGGDDDHAAAISAFRSASAFSGPLLATRPRPDDGAPPEPRRPARIAADASLDDIADSLDRMSDSQELVLDTIERSILRTAERLAAVPQAIGVSIPELEDGEADTGIGGPFVALRGSDQALDAENHILRLERALDRLDMLGTKVRRLPVRRPLSGSARITSGYGTRVDPFLGRPAMHTGVDFRATTGTPVLATGAGRIVRAGRAGGYGNLIEIEHGSGFTTRYAHLSEILVSRGQEVQAGEVIGKVGSTGRSTGPHLHYETRVGGRARNPRPFVEAADLVPEGY